MESASARTLREESVRYTRPSGSQAKKECLTLTHEDVDWLIALCNIVENPYASVIKLWNETRVER